MTDNNKSKENSDFNEYKNGIILNKIGLFYNTYNEGTIIIHNLNKYKLYNNNGIMCTSFTDKSIDLVLSRLRSMNVSYVVKTSKELTKYICMVTSYKELLDKTNKENERVMLLINISEFINKLEDIKLKELLKYLERR